MKYPDYHDVPAGPLKRCQISNNEDIDLVIDLGHQPLCDALLTEEQINQPEETYPLRFYRSKSLGHAQLDYVVPGENLYPKDYPYRPGITKEVVDHHETQSRKAIYKHDLKPGSFVVDIGSNDGTLLHAFKKAGMRVLGVEPTDTAKIARANGVETVQSLFIESLANEIAKDYGRASLVTATNVFAHMASLGEVVRGIENLLKDDGIFILENHYIVDILKRVQYDTIYHEHIRSYSLTSLVFLFDLYDFTVIDAEIVERYGGSIRVTVAKGKGGKVSDSVNRILSYEKSFGLFENHVWERFRNEAFKAKNDLLELALSAAAKGQRFVGKSCPGRCSTLINFTGIGKDLMPYIAEQPTSLKLGLYLPGKHIPIVSDEILLREQPDYIVLLAWHYWKPIAKILRKRGLKSKFIIPLPELQILD